jgi:hypothetical protein
VFLRKSAVLPPTVNEMNQQKSSAEHCDEEGVAADVLV